MLSITLPLEKEQSSAETIRNLNRSQVLEVFRKTHTISYVDLVEKVTLSRATVASIVNEMLEIGLLQKIGQAASTGGRRPTLLGYHPEAKMAVGVTMFDNEIKAVLTDMEGTPIKLLERPWDGLRFEDLISKMIDAVQDLCASVDPQRLLGVGTGLPGVVDVDHGTIVEYVTARRRIDTPIEVRRVMEEALRLPVIVANRSRTAALGELQVGVGRGMKNLVYLSIGHGIVAGVVLGGDLYFGTNFSSGEIGHNSVAPDGPLCGCGNRGCLEMFASDNAIVARAIEKAREAPHSLLRQEFNNNLMLFTTDIIFECARQEDPTALEIMNETGMYIGIALSGALNILNPQMVVLGGPIGCKAGRLLLDPMIREVGRHALPMSLSCVQIVSGSENTETATIGAAVLALKNTSIERIFLYPKT